VADRLDVVTAPEAEESTEDEPPAVQFPAPRPVQPAPAAAAVVA
jgi:hypothetical protein